MRNEFQIEVMWPADTDMGLRSWPMVNAWLSDRGMRSAWIRPESGSGVWCIGAMVKPGLPRLKRAVQAVSISYGASMRMPWEAGTVVEVLDENRDMRLVRQGSWMFWVNVEDLDFPRPSESEADRHRRLRRDYGRHLVKALRGEVPV